MYCFTSKTWLLVTVLAGLCLVSAAFAQEASEPEFLEIISQQGYSRLEIEDGNIVVFFTGELEFNYLELYLKANELRYNRKTKEAEVSGGVVLKSDGTTVNCSKIILNGDAGYAETEGPAEAQFGSPGIRLTAEALRAEFKPATKIHGLEDMRILLPKAVTITDAGGNVFAASNVVYEGNTGLLSCPGPFQMSFKLESGPDGYDEFSGEELTVAGSGISGSFSREGGMESVSFSSIRVEGEHLELEADTGLVEPVPGFVDNYTLVLGGSPVSGGARGAKGWVEFSANELLIELAEGDVARMELTKQAEVRLPEANFNSETILLDNNGDGYLVTVPGRFTVGLNLQEQGGGSVISIDKINSWFKN